MAAPNLIGATTITGKTAFANCTTSTSNVITNGASSGTVVKLNTIILTNYSSSPVYSNTIVNRNGTTYYLGGTIIIPSNSLLTLIGKDTSLYLEENDTLQVNVSANSSVHLSAGYELIAT